MLEEPLKAALTESQVVCGGMILKGFFVKTEDWVISFWFENKHSLLV